MTTYSIDGFVSFTLAILLLFVGKGLTQHVTWLRRYSIPEPVVGGALCAACVCILHYGFNIDIAFDLAARDSLLLYFFAALGLSSNLSNLLHGGRPLIILLGLATGFMVLQNLTGIALAGSFGLEPEIGLMVGSISLTGGVGTTLAWTPFFTEHLNIPNASEFGLAANMVGLLAACIIGGPVAGYLLKHHRVRPSCNANVEVGARYKDEPITQLDYYGVLLALFWLNMALMLGSGLSKLIIQTGLMLPDFVGCLIAGIALRALGDLFTHCGNKRLWNWPVMQQGVALLSDICLGLFLTMALMGLQLWLLESELLFIFIAMTIQIVLVVLFVIFVVFRAMGRDYEAVVMSAGFGGISLGSTATAIANMSAVTRQYGAAPKAFIVVPLVCGFFIDLVNALVIGMMVG